MGFLSGMLGLDAGKATSNAAKKNNNLIGAFDRQGQGIINTGEAKSAGALNQAVAGYDPYVKSGAAATTMNANALGLNGASGNAAATGAFQAGPGYDFAVDEAMRAAERGASAGGMLASGNLLAELQDRGSNLANKEYGSWLDRLSGASAQGQSAAGGQAGALGGLASLYQSTAGDRLGLASTVTQGRMGTNNQAAQGQEANKAAGAGLFGNLVSGGLKLATGGLF